MPRDRSRPHMIYRLVAFAHEVIDIWARIPGWIADARRHPPPD